MAGNNFLSPILNKIPKPFRNKYFLLLTFFFAWITLFTDRDILTNWRLQKIVNNLEEDKEYYTKKIEEAKQERLEQNVNKEKFAREKYYMKKPGEDVFIYVKEENK